MKAPPSFLWKYRRSLSLWIFFAHAIHLSECPPPFLFCPVSDWLFCARQISQKQVTHGNKVRWYESWPLTILLSVLDNEFLYQWMFPHITAIYFPQLFPQFTVPRQDWSVVPSRGNFFQSVSLKLKCIVCWTLWEWADAYVSKIKEIITGLSVSPISLLPPIVLASPFLTQDKLPFFKQWGNSNNFDESQTSFFQAARQLRQL